VAAPGAALAVGGAGSALTGPSPGRGLPSRVVALREDRWVLLDPREIRFAEADGNSVWLISDQGRLLAAALQHRMLVLSSVGILLLAALALGTRIGQDFFPEIDAGQITLYVQAPSKLRLDAAEHLQHQRGLARAIRAKQAEHFAALDLQRERVVGQCLGLTAFVALGEIAHVDGDRPQAGAVQHAFGVSTGAGIVRVQLGQLPERTPVGVVDPTIRRTVIF